MKFPVTISYALQASISLVLLFAIYIFLFRKNTFHHINRFILLSLMLFTLSLPIISRVCFANCTLPGPLLQEIATKTDQYLSNTSITPAKLNSPSVDLNRPNVIRFNWYAAIGFVYCIGLIYFLMRLGFQVASVVSLIRRNKKINYEGYCVVQIENNIPPFSFFRWIILNPKNYPGAQLRHIISHEKIHVLSNHSFDILLAELFAAFLWFHPVAWILKERLKLNLEYLVDQRMLQSGTHTKQYQYSLLNIGLGGSFGAVNHFNHSHIKKRIAMMNSKTSPRMSIWKYFFFIPAALILMLALSPLNGQSTKVPTLNTAGKFSSDMNLYLVIRSSTSAEQLKKIQSYLSEEGIDISFSNVKFNNENQLSTISVMIKQDGRLIGNFNQTNFDQPTAEPIVFYSLRHDDKKTGASLGYPKDLSEKDMKILESLSGFLKHDPAAKRLDLHGSAHLED